MLSGANIFERTSDEALRPWTLDPIVDDRLREEAFDFEDCLVITSPNKWAGGLGVSVLDKIPRENWHLRTFKTSTMEEFQAKLNETVLGSQETDVDAGIGDINGEVPIDGEIEGDRSESLPSDENVNSLEEGSSEGSQQFDLEVRPKTVPTNVSRRQLLRSIREMESPMSSRQKKALKSVRYDGRKGLHTMQITTKRFPALKKSSSLTVDYSRPKTSQSTSIGCNSDSDEEGPSLLTDLIGSDSLDEEFWRQREEAAINKAVNVVKQAPAPDSVTGALSSGKLISLPAIQSPVRSLLGTPTSTSPDGRYEQARASTPALAKLSVRATTPMSMTRSLGKTKPREMKSVNDLFKTVSGTSSVIFHEDFEENNIVPIVKEMLFATRRVAKETQNFMREDHTSDLLS